MLSLGKSTLLRCNKELNIHVKETIWTQWPNRSRTETYLAHLLLKLGLWEFEIWRGKCRNYVEKARQLRRWYGDAETVQHYSTYEKEESKLLLWNWFEWRNRLTNIFGLMLGRGHTRIFWWSYFLEFIYLTNKYDMPFSPRGMLFSWCQNKTRF